MEARRIGGFEFVPGATPLFTAGACANVVIDGKIVGRLGEIRGALVKEIRIKNPLFLAVLDLDALLACHTTPLQYRMPPPFPAVTRDVVFAADEKLEHRQVVRTIRDAGVEFLEAIELAEIFRDETIVGAGRKSMAYTVTYRCPDRTLTDEEANRFQEKVRLQLMTQLPVQIR